jgi:hypothetical protein
LPVADENAVPAPANVQAGVEEADAVRDDLGPLGLAPGPVANAERGEMEQEPDQGANAAPVVRELAAVEANPQAAVPPRPGFFSRAGTAFRGFASGVGSKVSAAGAAIKRALPSRETGRDIGAKSPLGGSIASVAGTHLNYVTSAASSTSPTLEQPGEFARSFTSGAFELTHQIASVVGIFFSALKAALDLRSLVSSVRVIRDLKAAKRQAEASGAEPNVVMAVDYAIRQKYEKVIKRAFGAAAALAALGAALAILIANPVGAPLAAIIIGGVGAAIFAYKIGRWMWKKWKTKTLGQKRGEIAQRLYNQIRARDVLALDAVRALHLDPEAVIAAPNGAKLIARKLKSS